MQPTVLYEDNHLLVVEKPPNMPAQADSSNDLDLLSQIKEYIRVRYEKPGAAYIGLVHRLDRPVGGVMVFARTSKAAARLGAQFQAGAAHKRYAAVVDGVAPFDAAYTDYLLHNERDLRGQVFREPISGAKKAMLRLHAVAHANGVTLTDIELYTGRKHQIRAQLAHHGLPIVYDQRYHPNPHKGQIALWAYALSFEHPTRKEQMTFFSPPKGEAFARFSTQTAGFIGWQAGYALYADEHMLLCDKREGVEVTTADSGEASLQTYMERGFGQLYPVHRLDANTTGLVLFGRNEGAQAALISALNANTIQKTYRCVTVGIPPRADGIYEAYARKDAQNGILCVRDEPFADALPIKTGCRVLERRGAHALLEVQLFTGRTHQIRAHLKHLGCPVLGDDKYGDREENKAAHAKRQQLCAWRLALHFAPGSPLSYLNGRVFETTFRQGLEQKENME